MALYRKRVIYPHLVSGAVCLLLLLVLLVAYPAETGTYSCVFSPATQPLHADFRPAGKVYPRLAAAASTDFNLSDERGFLPVTGLTRYESYVGEGVSAATGKTLRGVFLRDHETNSEHWIGAGKAPEVTPDGRYLVFLTRDDRLAPGDSNRDWDIVLYDRVRLRYELISVNSDGAQASGPGKFSAPSISANGRFVVFSADHTGLTAEETKGVSHIYLRDRLAHTTTLLTRTLAELPANDHSWQPIISPDGREVVFTSNATNLNGTPAVSADSLYRCNLQIQSPPADSRIQSSWAWVD
jgi:Tol biopolymer transport system component